MNSTAVIIPARAGSKGLPGKNLLNLGGVPLISYSIFHGLFLSTTDTYVLTDGTQIADEAIKFGAKIPYLRNSEGDARDEASTEEVIDNFLNYCNIAGKSYTHIVLLQPTSPLRSLNTLRLASILLAAGLDSALSLCPLDRFLWSQEGDQIKSQSYELNCRPRRQEVEGISDFIETGSMYVFSVEGYVKNGTRLFGAVKKILTPIEESFEIDGLSDLELIRTFLEKYYDKFGLHNFEKF